MKRVDAAGHDGNLYTDGDPGIGKVATVVEQTMMNSFQEELAVAIEAAGITLDGSKYTQLRDAIQALGGHTYKNLLINGGLSIWQRGTTVNLPRSNNDFYCADRWLNFTGGSPGAGAVSRQVAPTYSPSYPGKAVHFLWHNQTVGSVSVNGFMQQRIEDVKPFGGRGLTLSFYARVTSGTLSVTPKFTQHFGTGSTSADVVTTESALNITTTWTHHVVNVSLPAFSSPDFRDGSYLGVMLQFPNNVAFNFQIGDIQLEEGDLATDFEGIPEVATLAMCLRYYEQSYDGAAPPAAGVDDGILIRHLQGGRANAFRERFLVPKRSLPTMTYYAPLSGNAGKVYQASGAGAGTEWSVVSQNRQSKNDTGYPGFGAFPTAEYWARWTANAEL